MALATLLVGKNTYQIGADGIVRPDPAEADLLDFRRMQDLVDLDAPVEVKAPKAQPEAKRTQTKTTVKRKAQKKKG